MSRMSKKRKQEWSFFLNDRNRITYNALCRKCVHECKQSFCAIVIECRTTAPNAPKMDTTPHFLVHQRTSPGDGLSRERK